MIRHQFGQVEFASEHWFRLAATTLASRHPRGRPRDAGQAARRPHPADRPRRHQRADGEPHPRPARGRHQAGARHARRGRRRRPADPQRGRRRCSTSGCVGPDRAARPRRRLGRLRDDDRIERARRRASASGSSGSCASTTRRPSRRSSATACSTSWTRPSSPRATSSGGSSRALENRAYLGELVGSVAGAGRIQVFIGHENAPARDARRLARPRAVRPARPGDRRRRRPRARRGWATPRRSARSASCPA